MSDTEWQIFYRRYADYLSDLQSWGHAIGYTVHPDKLFLLLPPHAPTMDPSRTCLPPNLRITWEGLEISGALIGTDDYISRELETLTNTLLAKLKKVELLGRLQPQIAMRFLNHSISTLSTPFASIRPT